MRKVVIAGLMILSLLVVSCDSYSQTGSTSASYENASGGGVRHTAKKANGTISEEIETGITDASAMLQADVVLTVGKGSFRIELLGEDGEVTLDLAARDGETVSGRGLMAIDSSGEASYRVTADGAENVEYTIEYVYR